MYPSLMISLPRRRKRRLPKYESKGKLGPPTVGMCASYRDKRLVAHGRKDSDRDETYPAPGGGQIVDGDGNQRRQPIQVKRGHSEEKRHIEFCERRLNGGVEGRHIVRSTLCPGQRTGQHQEARPGKRTAMMLPRLWCVKLKGRAF